MRQLAAIVFADMVGYTALMQDNEQAARSKRARFKDVLDNTIDRHNGRLIQQYGDGCLIIFNSAIDAVQCAVDMQSQLRVAPQVDVRVGVHTGDITIEDGAVYGDGVNLASRIESLATPGSVLISEKVYDDIRNQSGIDAHELGHFGFKNVRQAMRVFAISNNGLPIPRRSELNGKTEKPVNKLAVLPFVNMSADLENEYFSDGITEEILNALTKVEGLQVTSRTSVFAFKGKQTDIRDIAAQLNVDKVLEGSVRHSGSRVRVTAQLINAADGYHIWSENYDRSLTDIFAVQDDISGMIANRLRENLLYDRAPARMKVSVRNVDAYTSYLKGLHYWNKVTPADYTLAIECFKKAIELEPEYALAYAMTANAYSRLGSAGHMLPAHAFSEVHRYADKALALDDSIPEGHVAKAAVHLLYEWRWDPAYQSLQRARQLNPGGTAGTDLLSYYYIIKGEKEKAIQATEQAVARDPLSIIMTQSLGNTYIFGGRYREAIVQADKLLEINPLLRSSIEMKGWATGMAGDWLAALPLFEEVHRLTKHPLKGLMGLGFTHAMLGHEAEALDCVARLEQRQQEDTQTVIDGDLLPIWYALGNMDKVFYHMERCIIKRMAPVLYFVQYPIFKSLRSDPRFLKLVNSLALGQ